MSKRLITFALTLTILFLFTIAASAAAALHHSIWSTDPLGLKDGDTGTWYNSFNSGNASASWTEGTRRGYFNAVGDVSGGSVYEFDLISIGTATGDEITGIWDIKRDGNLVCDGCVGKAYGLSGGIGDYFKIYVGDANCYAENWHYSGYITNRYDY